MNVDGTELYSDLDLIRMIDQKLQEADGWITMAVRQISDAAPYLSANLERLQREMTRLRFVILRGWRILDCPGPGSGEKDLGLAALGESWDRITRGNG